MPDAFDPFANLKEARREFREERRSHDEDPRPEQREQQHVNGHAKTDTLKFPLTRFDKIEMTQTPLMRVKGLLPYRGLAVVWGPPKCGKSFWVYDLVMHIALGRSYRGRTVHQGTVVYLALEGGVGFTRRVEAWRRKFITGQKNNVPFYLMDRKLDLLHDYKRLTAEIKHQVLHNEDPLPAVIVIDTLNRSLRGSEGKDEDMAKYIAAADTLHSEFKSLIIIVHHCGIAKDRPRGHTSLTGADDVQIAVIKTEDKTIVCTVEFMKDGEGGDSVASKLEPYPLGADRDGDPITSAIILPDELPPPRSKRKLTDIQILGLAAVQRCLAMGREVVLQTDCPYYGKWRAVNYETWRDQFYQMHPADKQPTKQKAFNRVSHDLQAIAEIALWDLFVLTPDKRDT